jgi:hypothetical protein
MIVHDTSRAGPCDRDLRVAGCGRGENSKSVDFSKRSAYSTRGLEDVASSPDPGISRLLRVDRTGTSIGADGPRRGKPLGMESSEGDDDGRWRSSVRLDARR